MLRKLKESEIEKAVPGPKTELRIYELKNAKASNLAQVIEKFLTPEGVIAADEDTNSIIISDLPDGLISATTIINALDIPRRSQRHNQPQRSDQRRRSNQRKSSSQGKNQNRQDKKD